MSIAPVKPVYAGYNVLNGPNWLNRLNGERDVYNYSWRR
jgi:hypothetical protein